MHLALIVLGWVVVACGAVRTAHLLHLRVWGRAAMVGSWVVLAGGLSVMAMLHGDSPPSPLQYVFGAGLILGVAGIVLARVLGDRRHVRA